MDRRNFFRTMVGGVAAAAAVRTFPFRVFSFPSEIKIAKDPLVRFVRMYDPIQHKMLNRWDMVFGFGLLHDKPEVVLVGKTVADVMTQLRGRPEDETAAYNELVRRQSERIFFK